jgi:isopentenyldiphosphate isomerase
MTIEMLDVVDEDDNVVGTASRTEIHQKGLLHREAHVFFITPSGEFIFQRRSKTKDSYPDKLDVTVGGHVELGDSYLKTALKETLEETGLLLQETDLIPVHKIRSNVKESTVGGVHNNRFSMVYIHIYKGSLSDLKAEVGKIDGFESFSGYDIFNMPTHINSQFIEMLVDPESLYAPIYKKSLELVSDL